MDSLQQFLIHFTGKQSGLDTVIAKFDQHFIRQTNKMYERYVFNKRDQEQGERIDSYITMRHNLMKSCNFCEYLHDSLLCKVLGVRDNQARKRILQLSTLNLGQCIDICQSCEATTTQLKAMRDLNVTDEINSIKTKLQTEIPY